MEILSRRHRLCPDSCPPAWAACTTWPTTHRQLRVAALNLPLDYRSPSRDRRRPGSASRARAVSIGPSPIWDTLSDCGGRSACLGLARTLLAPYDAARITTPTSPTVAGSGVLANGVRSTAVKLVNPYSALNAWVAGTVSRMKNPIPDAPSEKTELGRSVKDNTCVPLMEAVNVRPFAVAEKTSQLRRMSVRPSGLDGWEKLHLPSSLSIVMELRSPKY